MAKGVVNELAYEGLTPVQSATPSQVSPVVEGSGTYSSPASQLRMDKRRPPPGDSWPKTARQGICKESLQIERVAANRAYGRSGNDAKKISYRWKYVR